MAYRSNVDEQVVKMSFDNSNFDSNVNDSIKTLNSLDNKLASLNNANFSGLNSGMESLANFLTVKGQVMFGVLTRLGNEVVNFGIKAKNALFGGIRDGLGEYNTIINSTQTIFQNVRQSGATIKDVNAALDELNDYADLTIYNFGQMTNMIGKFTAAGVGLKKSVSTIKGLANAAALVGATPEKAEQAWQAVSRAMARGTFNLRTWYSLQTSSIASEQFVKVIKDVARANNALGKSGKNIDQMLEQYGSLEYTLSENWLTSDLFNEAMSILSGDLKREQLVQKGYTEEQINELLDIAEAAEEAATQIKTFKQLMDTLAEAMGSGWAQSFRILIGDLDQAKALYTRISNVISELVDNSAKIRNELFKQIMGDSKKEKTGIFAGLTTGRDSFKQTIENMMATVKTFLKAVKTGFLNIFPIERIATAARKAMDVIQQFTRAFVLNSEEAKQKVEGITGWDTSTIDKISESVKDLIRFFRGLASAIDIVWMAFSQPIKAVVKRIPFLNNFFENLGSSIKNITSGLGKFGDKITVIRNAFRNTNAIEKIVGYFLDNIEELGKKYPILGAILWVFNAIKTALAGIKDVFKSINIKPLAMIFGAIKFIAESIWKIVNFVFGLLKTAKDSIDWSFLEGPKNAVIGFLKKLSDYGQGLISFEELVGKIGEKISKVFSTIIVLFNKSGSSNKFADDANKSYSKLGDTVAKTGNKIQTVWDKVKSFFSGIGTFFKNMFANADWSLEGIAKKIALVGGGVTAAALAISHLSKTIGKVRVLNNLNNLLNAGTKVLKAYQKQLQSTVILNIAIAIGILAAALVGLSFVPYDKLENGLVIFTSFMATLAVTLTPIITALAKFNDSLTSLNDSANKFTVMETFLKKYKTVFNKLARGFEFRMLGKMFKDLAIAILILVGAMTALVFLFKYEKDNLINSAVLIAGMIAVMTAAIAGLILVLEKTSKVGKNVNSCVGTFSSFFKLAGVSGVILAMAGAVLILAGAMSIMAKQDPERMRESWAYVMGFVGLLGAVAVGVAFFTSKAKDLGKLKKITVSLAGALVGVAVVLLAMKPLIEAMNGGDGNAWIKAIAIFTTIIGQFTAMAVVLLLVANKISGKKTLWEQLDKTILSMTGIILSIGVVIYAISKLGDVSWQTVAIVGIIAAVLLGVISLLALIAVVISKAKGTFSTNFANVIYKISISIAAVIAAIGVMAAGIAALVAALSSMSVSDSGINKASANILTKLEMIADTIEKALPKLKSMFFRIGISVGSVMISFLSGIITSFVTNGGEILEIADKFVNIVIDVLDKVVEILYNRKDDIARIIKRVLEFLFAEITAVLNSFFKKKDGTGLFTENGVAKLLGIIGGGIGILKIAKYFNTLTGSVKKLGTALKSLGMNWSGYKTIGENLSSNNAILMNKISNLKLIKSFGNSVAGRLSKITGKDIEYDSQTPQTPAQTLAALGAILVAVKAVEVANHGIKQLLGEELPYVRTDVTDGWSAFKMLFQDKMFLLQVAIEGTARFGELLVTLILTIVKGAAGVITALLTPLVGIGARIVESLNRLAQYYYQFMKNDLMAGISKETADEMYEYRTKTLYDKNAMWWQSIGKDWKQFNTTIDYDEYIDGANQAGYEAGKGIVSGEVKGINDNIVTLNTTLSKTTQEGIDTVKRILKEHSPSKVFEEIYKNVMYGSVNGIENNKDALYRHFKDVTNTLVGMAENDTEAISAAMDAVLKESPDFGAMSLGVLSDNTLDERLEYYNKVAKNYGADSNDPARRLKFGEEEGLNQQVELNEKLLNLAINRAETYDGIANGIDKATLHENLMKIATEEVGMAEQEATLAVSDLMAVLETATNKQAADSKFLINDFNTLSEFTSANIIELIGKQRAASEIALTDIATNYANMGQIAEAHKEELIGLKQEEVQEKLKAEAVAAGMSEQAAEDSSRMITATLFAGASDRTSITEAEFNYRIKLYKGDLQAYEKYQAQKTFIEQEAARLRAAIEANAAHAVYDEAEKMAAAGADVTSIVANIKNSTTSADRELHSYLQSSLNTALSDLDKLEAKAWDGLYTSAERAGVEDAEAWANSYIDQAMNIIGKQQTNKSGGIVDILSNLWSSFGAKAPDVDLKWWNFTDITKDDSTLSDSEVNSAISAASDLKDGLESQRADLTPTFDLDKLAEDAQKANGIVMSSLMAAQNASIGDYINQDSELNPFMKDRWQNVYNFTQNNYSPKALSRIDIYRQTQRQLGMSRGF